MYQKLTELMKKSWWMRLTIPKFVYLNNRSIIHIMFGRIFGFVLKLAIINGTSAVDWWFAITMVLTSFLRAGAMSSPSSTTKNGIVDWIIVGLLFKQYSIRTYYHIQLSTTTWPQPTKANGKIVPRCDSRDPVYSF